MAVIYERNPDTGVIRSRKLGDYGNEQVVVNKDKKRNEEK